MCCGTSYFRINANHEMFGRDPRKGDSFKRDIMLVMVCSGSGSDSDNDNESNSELASVAGKCG